MNPALAAMRIGIAIVEHDGRFLVGARGETSPLPGLAEFPGGKCHDGETPADCAVRECREETGLDVLPLRVLDQRTHEYPHGTVELHFWLCQPSQPRELGESHCGFRWVRREDLPSLDFPKANQPVIALLAGEA